MAAEFPRGPTRAGRGLRGAAGRLIACGGLLFACGGLLIACGGGEPAPAPADRAAGDAAPDGGPVSLDPLPTDSLYQLPVTAVDQTGAPSALDRFRGQPVLISMFYASCPAACPLLIRDIQALEAALPAPERAQLRVLLVSLDPARDTPEALAAALAQVQADPGRWAMLRTAPGDVRAVAAALGIRYRPTPDGEMNHSSILTVLDADGRPKARLEGLGRDPAPLVEALRGLHPTL
jgi:protein SCO1/2